MSAHVDQLTRHWVVFIQRFTHSLVAAAYRGQSHEREHRVQQPSPASTMKLATRSDDHPDHQRQQGRGPHPSEDPVNLRAEHHQEQTAQPHEQRRSRSPPLRLIGEPHREHGQHRPTQRESAQDRAGDVALLRRDERGGNEEQSRDESGGQRAGHDPTNVSPRPSIRASRAVLAHALGGWASGWVR